jgi:hypothetical protein
VSSLFGCYFTFFLSKRNLCTAMLAMVNGFLHLLYSLSFSLSVSALRLMYACLLQSNASPHSIKLSCDLSLFPSLNLNLLNFRCFSVDCCQQAYPFYSHIVETKMDYWIAACCSSMLLVVFRLSYLMRFATMSSTLLRCGSAVQQPYLTSVEFCLIFVD